MNSRLFDTWIRAYSMREFTLIRCVNARLYKAAINTCTKCEVMSEESEDLAFLNHVISRDQNISSNHSPLLSTGLRLKFISLVLLVFLMITKFIKEQRSYGLRKSKYFQLFLELISLIFVTIAYSFNQLNNMTGYHR